MQRYAVEIAGEEHEVTLESLDGGRVRLTRAGVAREYDVRRLGQGGNDALVTSWSILEVGSEVGQEPGPGGHRVVDVEGRDPDLSVTLDGVTTPVKLTDARLRAAEQKSGAAARRGPLSLTSPMPGKVVRVLVRPGEELKAGQGVAVVEAMKMENELKAPRDGKVVAVRAKEGQAVEANETIVMLE
jgi:biotin carboxyl carrier protein